MLWKWKFCHLLAELFQTRMTSAGEHKRRYSEESQAHSFGYHCIQCVDQKCDSYDSCCEKKNMNKTWRNSQQVLCVNDDFRQIDKLSCKTNSSDTLMLNDTEINQYINF